MSKQTINIGQTANDRTGDPLRVAFEKINNNFTELYAVDASNFDGSYNSLTDKPTIPTAVSELTNDSGFITADDLPEAIDLSVYALSSAIPDVSNFITADAIPDVSNFITADAIPDVSNFITADAVPTDISEFTDNTNLLGGSTYSDSDARAAISIASTGTTYTRANDYADLGLTGFYQSGYGFEYISAQNSFWNDITKFSNFVAQPNGTEFTVTFGEAEIYTFTVSSSTGEIYYGSWAPTPSRTISNETITSISFGATVSPLNYDNNTGEINFDASVIDVADLTDTSGLLSNIDTGVVRFNSNVIHTAAGQNLVINPSNDSNNRIVIPGAGNGENFALSLTNTEGNITLTTGDGVYTFSYDPMVGSNLEIPGSIQGGLQTGLVSSNGLGIGIDGFNTPNYVDVGNIASSKVLRITDGASGSDVILRSLGAATVQAGTSGPSWEFGTDGSLTFPDDTVQTTAWDGTVRKTLTVDPVSYSLLRTTDYSNGSTNYNGDIRTHPSDLNKIVATVTVSWSQSAIDGFAALTTGATGLRVEVAGWGSTYPANITDVSLVGNVYTITFDGPANGSGFLDFNIYRFEFTTVGSTVEKEWIFDTDGNLTLPNNGVISAGGSGGLTLGGNFDVKIIADYTDNNRTWSFNGTDGSITFPDTTVQTTAFTTSPTLNVLKIDDGVHEKFQRKSNVTGTVEHDCSGGHIFYHQTPDANWTVNLTNLNLASDYATTITLVIEQGATGRIPSAVQVDGNSVPLIWQGNTTPTPSNSRIDVVSFSILYDGLWTVLGQLTGF